MGLPLSGGAVWQAAKPCPLVVNEGAGFHVPGGRCAPGIQKSFWVGVTSGHQHFHHQILLFITFLLCLQK